MKKRLQFSKRPTALIVLGIMVCFSQLFEVTGSYAQTVSKSAQTASSTIQMNTNEVRAVWISYFELESMLKNKTEAEFRDQVSIMFSGLAQDKMNTVMVQVRPFGDALYKSKLFPSSYLITGVEGDAMAFDPFKIMIEEAKHNKLKIEAWLNPYRVRINTIKAPISMNNRAVLWQKDGSNRVVKISSGTFYNPSDERVNALIVDGVKEIINNYAVDGIHFDDYFYPTSDASFDKIQYASYLKKGGKLKLADFRRERINQMVKSVYKVCKSGKRKVQFGISPQGLIQNNYDSQYADVKKWVSTKGYVDYICPQIYYGFRNSKAPFMKILEDWNRLTKNSKVDVYIGLAPYKIGVDDKWSGTGKLEWLEDENILSRMVLESQKVKKYKGFVIFRYDSLWKPDLRVMEKVNLERLALLELFKNQN